jgi:ADP-heptose:LPS heptosyltransferase
MFGLGEIVRTEAASFPRVPYLVADPDLRTMFRALFGEKKVIGLAWSGGLPRTGESERLAGLNAFLPLVKRGGTFLSLQYRDDAEEVAKFEREHGISIMRLPWVTQSPNVDLLAALIAELSEVIGVHTTALHLSSALGVPTSILTHRGSGWRYAQPEILWYPKTTQMHRKRTGESWRDCVSRLVEKRK